MNNNKNLEHVFILAKSHHYGHELAFQKYAGAYNGKGAGWASALHFSNGGLSVDLLRMDH